MNLLAIGIIPSSGLPVRSQGGNSLTTPTATYFGWYYVLTPCSVWYGSWQLVRSVSYLPATRLPYMDAVTIQMTRYFAQEKKSIHCERLDNN